MTELHKRTYHDAKLTAEKYCQAKSAVLGPNGPFFGWLISGARWESFISDAKGRDLPNGLDLPLRSLRESSL